MIIVSCPYCFKAQYIVVKSSRKHEQRLGCKTCKRHYLIRVTPRGRSGAVDAECARLEEVSAQEPVS